MKRVTVIGLLACSICPLIALAIGAEDMVIADFERADYGEWKVEGKAFGDAPAKGALPGQMNVSGYQGDRLVNSFYGGDGSTGVLVAPPF
ncbi:hypothetical protein GF373_12610, partial [bacterium]|nr:hypothetical protein [bacterium]